MTKKSNILVIDNDSNENTISYKKSMINSEYICKPGLTEFLDIFKNDHLDIMSVDSRNAIMMVDKSGKVRSLHKYRPGMEIAFFKITDPMLKKHDAEIYIDARWTDEGWQKMIFSSIQWSYHRDIYAYTIDDITEDSPSINGYEITKKIKRRFRDIGDRPYFIEYCGKRDVSYNDNVKYKGYMPSAYQMKIIYKCIDVINYFMTDMMGYNQEEIFPDMKERLFWTINEVNDSLSYIAGLADDEGEIDYSYGIGDKDMYYYVFPIYKPVKF